MKTASARTRRETFRSMLTADGAAGPIEVRYGHRLLRVVSPESREGLTLLEARRVELVAPGGEPLGTDPADALRSLLKKLEQRLADPDHEIESRELEDGLERLRKRCRKIGHA